MSPIPQPFKNFSIFLSCSFFLATSWWVTESVSIPCYRWFLWISLTSFLILTALVWAISLQAAKIYSCLVTTKLLRTCFVINSTYFAWSYLLYSWSVFNDFTIWADLSRCYAILVRVTSSFSSCTAWFSYSMLVENFFALWCLIFRFLLHVWKASLVMWLYSLLKTVFYILDLASLWEPIKSFQRHQASCYLQFFQALMNFFIFF